MVTFKEAISALEKKYGKIDNIKFFLDASIELKPDAVIYDFCSVVMANLEGRAPASTEYADAGLSQCRIEL